MSLSDTTPEIEEMRLHIYRSQTPAQKWLILDGAYRLGRLLHEAGVRARIPGATARQVVVDWIHRVLASPHVPVPEKGMDFTPIVGIAEVRVVTRVLDRLGIKYALGGSIASGVYGYPRSTQDADLSVEEFQSRAQALIDALGSDYYVSRQAIDEAHQRHSSFNILHTPTGFKIDLFVAAPSGFPQMILNRRKSHSFSDVPEEPISICSAEDVVLLKLQWYRLGNEVSDHQWNDIVGVLKTREGQLDSAYLDHWASQLGVSDLLARARQESGV